MTFELDPQRLERGLASAALAAVAPHLGPLVVSGALSVEALDRALASRAGIRFVVQDKKRRRGEPFVPAESYDGSIALSGRVPTREGSLHDVMNAAAWAAFPESKRAIHARQFRALSHEVREGATQLPGKRSRLRDRLSMLDEGGILVTGSEAVERALRIADREALVGLRLQGRLEAQVLGHAVTEHVIRTPDDEVRGCAVWLSLDASVTSIDAALASIVNTLEDDALEAWIGRLPSIPLSWLV